MRAEGACEAHRRLPSRSLEHLQESGRATRRATARSRSPVSATLRRARGDRAARPGLRAAARCVGLVGPSGCGKSTLLELIAGLLEPDRGTIAVDGERAGRGRLAGCAYMPQRDLLLPWLTAIDNAGAGATQPRRLACRCARRGGAPVRALRARRIRAQPADRALGRDAPAGRLPAHAARRQAGAAARRALRLLDAITRARCRSWLAQGRSKPKLGRCSWSPTTSRRRSISPTVCSCSRRRPAASGGRARGPAPRALPRSRGGHAPAFVAAARACAGGAGGGSAMRRWLPPLVVLAACIGLWELAARWDLLADALGIEPFLVPAPSDIAEALWTRPRAARRERVGDRAGGRARIRARARRRRSCSPSSCTSPTCCAAPSIPCWWPRRRSR